MRETEATVWLSDHTVEEDAKLCSKLVTLLRALKLIESKLA
jgi:hypothetical protein